MPPIGAPLATDDLAFPATLADAGFAVIPHVLPRSLVESARTAADALIAASVTEGKISAGVRWAIDRSPSLAATLQSSEIAALIDTLASGRRVWLVRSILFDKTAASNWLVPWHQDTTISVRSRIDTPGFTSWCERDGRLQCDPPAAILDDMFTLRIHLDD